MLKRGSWKTTRDEREEMRSWADAATIGWFFFAAIGIGFLAGAWLDKKFDIAPWATLAGAFLGIAAGFRNLIQVANRMAGEDKRKDDRK